MAPVKASSPADGIDFSSSTKTEDLNLAEILVAFYQNHKELDGKANFEYQGRKLPNGYCKVLIDLGKKKFEWAPIFDLFIAEGYLYKQKPSEGGAYEKLKLKPAAKELAKELIAQNLDLDEKISESVEEVEEAEEKITEDLSPANLKDGASRSSFQARQALQSGKQVDELNDVLKDKLINKEFLESIPLVSFEDQKQIENLRTFLDCSKPSVILTGAQGSAKSYLVYDLAKQIQDGKFPNSPDLKFLRVSGNDAGMLEQLPTIYQAATNDPNLVVYFTDLEGFADTSGVLNDEAKIITSFIKNPKVKTIVETIPEIANPLLNSNPAWQNHFQKIDVKEPQESDSLAIAKINAKYMAATRGVKCSQAIIQQAFSYADRYLPSLAFPGKLIDLLDGAAGVAKESKRTSITEQDLKTFVARKAKLPENILDTSGKERLKTISETLKSQVINQAPAIDAVTKAIRRRITLGNASKPVGSFLFLGPTGVGKTELAKALADWWLGDRKLLHRIDMGEFTEGHSTSSLLGAPPGYVGYENGGQLTNHILEHPFGVTVFDEFEKADGEIIKPLLPLFDEGRLTDRKGRTIDARNYIFIMTSNIAAEEIVKISEEAKQSGQSLESAQVKERIETAVLKALKEKYSPEFLNRFTWVVFNGLEEDALTQVAKIKIASLKANLMKDIQVELDVSQDAIDYLINQLQNSNDKQQETRKGGRAINTIIENLIENPLSDYLLDVNPDAEKLMVDFDMDTQKIIVQEA